MPKRGKLCSRVRIPLGSLAIDQVALDDLRPTAFEEVSCLPDSCASLRLLLISMLILLRFCHTSAHI